MTTSAYMPDVQVHIAFDSGYNTPAASRTWTDVSAYVELAQGINITRGRQDEFATTDPNKLTLTLDNRDGRFTAGKTGGTYYPNVKIGRPIKVTSTPVGGAASIRFLGYVDEWPVEWTGTDSYATAKISASSRMARLGFDAELRSVVTETFLAALPTAYYPLGEGSDATFAAPIADAAAGVLVTTGSGAAVGFGGATGPSTDAATATLFAGGQYLTGTANGKVTLEAFASTTQATDGTIAAFSGSAAGLVMVYKIGVSGGFATASRVVTGVGGTTLTVTSPTAVNDGSVFHIAADLRISGANRILDLYVDGVLVDSDSALIGSSPSVDILTVGQSFTGGISHVMTGTDSAGIADRAEAGLTGFADESAADRIERYAGYADIDPLEISTDSGTNPVSAIDLTGKSVIDAMRTVEETESGVLFDARDNTLTFHGRARRYSATSAFTLDVSLQEVEAGVTPKLDRSALVNDVTATAADGTTARAINQDSIDTYGYARETIEIASTNEAAFQAASWRVNTYGEPQPRIPSLGVDLLPLSQARQDSLFTLDMSSKITLSNLPAQAPASSITFFIEGYTESIGEMSYGFDFNVSPTTGFDVWTCQDATYGAFDEYPIAL